MNKTQILIASSGTAAVGGLIYLLLRDARRQNQFNELMLTIQESKAESGGDISYLNAFKPGYEKESTSGKKIILYTTAKVDQIVDAIYEAFKNRPLKLSGTDEEALYTIYSNIENQKKMAQVATRYQSRHGESLIDKINSELNKNERTRLFVIIKNKPAIQYQS
jgi:multidrug efflux pump subunit AcrB